MGVRRYHVERDAVRKEHIPSGEIPAGDLEASTIEFVENIEAINGIITLPADAVGYQIVNQRFYLEDQDVKHLKAAYLDMAYAWAATADGKIQLFNTSDGVVAAETATKTGGESDERERLTISIANLPGGKAYRLRLDITTAGAAGETVELRKMTLKLVKGIS